MRLVYHMERTTGAAPALIDFFVWWQAHGPFPITITPDGGVRRDAAHQLELFNRGQTKAKTLDLTPHGRGGAIDAMPAVVVQGIVAGVYTDKDGVPGISRYTKYGELAEAHDLEWGGRWTKIFPPYGDMPHVQVSHWQLLPFPPPVA